MARTFAAHQARNFHRPLLKRSGPVPAWATAAALDVLGGKWQVFSQLQKQIPGVTQKLLTQQLRELEDSGLVARRIYAEVPPREAYCLTVHGRTLHPVLASLREWGTLHRAAILGQPPVFQVCQLVENLVEAG